MQTKGEIAATRCSLGLRIKCLRNERDLSQQRFANMVGIDRSYMSGIENGHRNVSFDNLVRIAQGFGISLSDLMAGVDVCQGGS